MKKKFSKALKCVAFVGYSLSLIAVTAVATIKVIDLPEDKNTTGKGAFSSLSPAPVVSTAEDETEQYGDMDNTVETTALTTASTTVVTTTATSVTTDDADEPDVKKRPLTLDSVMRLAQKGEELCWADLDEFEGKDVGFGMYIMTYEINEKYNLTVGGGSPLAEEKPMYAWLNRVENGKIEASVDIRTEDVADFIAEETTAATTSAVTTTTTTTTTTVVTTTAAPVTTAATSAATAAPTTTAAPVVTTTTTTTTTPPPTFNQYANEVVSLVNVERQNAGVSPVQMNATLNAMAQLRAQELAVVFSHTRPDGRGLRSVFEDFGVEWWFISENIAGGYLTPGDVMTGWMNSPGHKDNILSTEVNQMGVGVTKINGVMYWVQIFAALR